MTPAEWASERIVATMWWCGDEECDCWQPLIEKLTPNYVAGYPWIRRETIWAGTFVSHGTFPEDSVDLKAELRAACAERGLIWKEVADGN